MIKALPTMELFQVIKRYIKQSGLNFQKCYERDQNKRAGGREPHNRFGSRGLDKSISIFSFYFVNYFFQYSKTIFKFCCLSFLLKRITQKTYASMQISRCRQDKTVLSDNFKRNLHHFNMIKVEQAHLFDIKMKQSLFVKYTFILTWSFLKWSCILALIHYI